MRRRSLLLAVVLLAAGGMWMATGGDVPEPPPGPPPLLPEPPTPTPDVAPPLPPVAADTPRVHIEVTPRETFVAPPEPRVVGVRASDGSNVPASLLAGAGAGFDGSPRASGVALVAFEHHDGRVLRQVALRDGLVEVRFAARVGVSGRVAGPDGQMLPGATVWFGEHDHDGNRREVTTDAEGAYVGEALAGDGVPFVVRAPGFATQWRAVRVGMPSPVCDARLERACGLDVQLAATATELAAARVFVLPSSQVGSALAHWPFFGQAITGGYAVDDNGRAAIDDLPAAVTVELLVLHPRAVRGTPQPVVLKGERTRALVPLAFADETWHGSVVDEAGAPLADVSLWVHDGRRGLEPGSSQRLLPPHLGFVGAFAAATRADGTFTVGAAKGRQQLSLRAPGRAGRDVEAGVVAAGQPIVLPRWNGGNAVLTVRPPRAGAAWVVEGYAGARALAADEAWSAALPHEGLFDVVLTTWLGEREVARERHRDLAATGPVELAAPRLP
jgi:hypothetical protein